MFSRLRSTLSRIEALRCLYAWITQFADPLKILRGVSGLNWYFRDWYRYSRLPYAERIRLLDTQPALRDRTSTTPFGGHYFFVNGWAMRRILANHPAIMTFDRR